MIYQHHLGTQLYAVSSGIVTLAKFDGANGYSVHISNGEITFVYGHISPNYIVSVGNIINQNDIIGYVGPKYVETTLENHYKDYTGKSTNGSITGPHLHFEIRKDGIAVNPLDFF